MRFKVVVTDAAARDLDDMFRFIARDNPFAARKFVDGLRRRLRTLASMPRRCPHSPEDSIEGVEIRQLVYGQYRIIFRIDADTVSILQVRHGARLPMAEGG